MNAKGIPGRIVIITLFLILLITSAVFPGNQDNGEKDNIGYFRSNALFKYLISYPEGYSKDKRYNLIIALHGGGSSPEKFISDLNILAKKNLIISPQAPYSWLVGDKIGYDWALWPSGDELPIEKASRLTEQYIVDLTNKCRYLFKTNKIYLLGFSQGAIYTYIAGIKNHKLIDGLISLSGPGLLENLKSPFLGKMGSNWLPEQYIKKGNKLRIFIANGETDKSTTVELGIKSRDVLKSFGYDVEFLTFDGGHEVNSEVVKNVMKWIDEAQ